MRVKRLLTAALCAVLAIVSCNMSSAVSENRLSIKTGIVYAASDDGEVLSAEGEERTLCADGGSGDSEVSLTADQETDPPQNDGPKEESQVKTETESQTQKPTEGQTATESQTQKPTEGQTATEGQTQKTTEGQTVTEGQTQKPTEGQTATESQTQKPTEGQTATESQTQKPTEDQTATEGQTQKPTEGQTATEGQTHKPTEGQTATEAGTESSTAGSSESTGTEQLPSETTPGTEGATEVPGTEAVLPGETVMTETSASETLASESESEKKKKKETETESESESETSLYGSNEELIRHQNIVRPPDITLEFRFTQVEAEYAIVQNRDGISIYESRSEDAEAVGELAYYGVCCILEDCGDGWYYVESRNVRGFAKAEEFATGEVAERIVNVKGLEELPEARLLVARTENDAYDYTHTTVQEVLAEKVYAIADGELEIYEQRKTSADVTGVLAEGALCYILADGDKEWVYVESGNARGFVEKDRLITGSKAEQTVEKTGENNMKLADVKIDPEDNEACYYTLTSVKKASESAKLREDIVNFALDYLGNPYVWGGTSLTNGADCSGFVQSVYAHFGYYLPRVAEAQSAYGMQIPVDSAAPGDLIFYARNGYVYHVSMYIGNGQVVHAAGRKVGIITSGIDSSAVWATRIITD